MSIDDHDDREAFDALVSSIEDGMRGVHLSPALKRSIAQTEARKIGSNRSAENRAGGPVPQSFAASSSQPCVVAPSHPQPTPPQATSLTTPSTTRLIPPASSSTTPKRARSKTLQAAVSRLVDPSKPWRDLWRHEQLARVYEAAGARGGLVFTLRLSPKREAFLLQRRDPADDLRRYIARELSKAFGRAIPVAFIFEVSPTGVLHVHGVILPPSSDEASRKLLRDALARAGGRISGRGAARQVDLQEIEDGYGWAAYTQKAFDLACRFLGTNKITFASTDLIRLAKG